ncbi:unnamed protein product [Adineta steineri]|uniref:Uncharacterized protein n=1 Tax=Adineta steineri TaxID=433720 RepID=A0A813ZCW5_9BILA|nr:unnamed protein product [Adineta steineri]CAF1458517.1 unnamed protein product [Adineta steineri]
MSFDERDKIIITIICGIVSFIFIVIIICFLLRLIIRYYRSKSKHMNSNEENNPSPISTYHRQQYQRSQKHPSTKLITTANHNIKKNRKRRLNTNESVITLSFDPPHLINQNVKNLEKLLNNESTLTANSWHYEETFPTKNCYYKNASNEPVYASSSTVLTSISNSALAPQQNMSPNIHFVNELDHVLRLKQEERTKHRLKHSQSCRQTSDLLPFDYYRSISPPSTITGTSSSNNNSLEPIYISTNKYSNTTLARKAQLAQLRDDTAILY